MFRVSKTVRPDLTKQQFYMDKSLLLQAAFLHQEGCHLYAQRTWEYEVTAAEQLADILKDPALPVMEIPKELRAGDILLSEQQRKAIGLALNSRLAVILGGAGSGKTTLIEAIVHCFRGSVDSSEAYVLAAPTGKAARNLTERTGIEARTVHGALGKIPDTNFLDAVCWIRTGLVVVDEASMVSLEMLAGILNRVRRNCRVVLLGDPNQLLSVGAGNVLSDLLKLGVPSIFLEQQYRQSAAAAYNICNGDVGVLYIRGEKPHRVATLAVRGTLKTWQIDCVEKYGAANDDAPPPRLALAYALTVHKSQGSQYDAILMPVSTATAKMLYRNLLYTAISRARKEVILVGSREAVNTAMQCIPYPRKSKLVARTNLLRLRRSA